MSGSEDATSHEHNNTERLKVLLPNLEAKLTVSFQ